MRSNQLVWLGAGGVLAMVALLYLQTLQFGFVWDDDQILYARPDYQTPTRWLEAVRQPLDFSPNYFRPLALTSLLVQIWLWGDNPMPFHLANLLIHLVNTGLVMLLAGRWFGRGWAVVAVGALYGLHPALVESVAFVSSRYDLLTTTFLLIALLSEMILTGWKRLVGVGVSFLLALLCKEMAVVLWLLLPFWLWVKRRVGLVPSASPVPALPLFGVLLGVSLVYLGVRYLSLGYLL
ncbi:MAG: hypothetical protein SNJ72_04030, partial [Fimbriimonadales bacterium]